MKKIGLVLILVLVFGFSIGYAEAQTHRHWHYDLGKLEYTMSTEQVRKIWGRPDHINRSVNQGREIQQWIYIELRNPMPMADLRIFLYFINGEFDSYEIFGEK